MIGALWHVGEENNIKADLTFSFFLGRPISSALEELSNIEYIERALSFVQYK